MKFLKKLFNKNTNPEFTQKREVPRAKPSNVNVTIPSLAKNIPVRNISVTGIAIDVIPEITQLTANLQISAQLNILEKTFIVDLKVLRRSDYIVAFAFLRPNPEMIQEISRVFLTEFNAQTIQYISQEKLQPVPDGKAHWYYGGENYQLFFVENSGEVIRFFIQILSDTIEKKPNQKLNYGRIWSDGPLNHDEGPKYKGSELIEQQKALPASVMKNAASFVSHIPKLPKRLSDQIIEELKN
jgi:hypothetical protein